MSQGDPLARFGEATSKPNTDTTARLKQRLDVYVAQDVARARRARRQKLKLGGVALTLVALIVLLAAVLG